MKNDFVLEILTLCHDRRSVYIFENYYNFGLETNLSRVKDKAIVIIDVALVPFLPLTFAGLLIVLLFIFGASKRDTLRKQKLCMST